MKERIKNILLIAVSAVLLISAFILTKYTRIPEKFHILLFLPSYLFVGFDTLKEAIEKLFKGRLLDESFLMSIASIGALLLGEYSEAVFVMMFFNLGEILEGISVAKSKKSITELADLRPDSATVIINGQEKKVGAAEVNTGDIIIVKAGERVALDGEITDGFGSFDTSALTGEALPKNYVTGEKVLAGFINLSGVIKVKVLSRYEDSAASRIVSLITVADEKKAKEEKFITRFAKVYTPLVVALAIIIAVVPTLIFGNFSKYIYISLSFLVVSCPCALVISIPLCFFGAIGSASRHGILIKGSSVIERFCDIKTAIFDKTGTLTKGEFSVTAVHPNLVSEQELIRIAAAAENYSNHPISLSLKKAYIGKEKFTVSNIKEIAGEGISATVDGKQTLVGNKRFMESFNIKYEPCFAHHNGTVVDVAQDGVYLGHIVVNDTLKESSKEAIGLLKSDGIGSVMLTGDTKEKALEIAESLNIKDCHFGLLPEDKVRITEEIKEKSPEKSAVAFIGDGINDAPVIASADIGIAMGGMGSDAAISSADVVIMDDDIRKIHKTLKISKKAVKISKENIYFSITVKVAVLVLSLFGIEGVMSLAAFADVGVLIIAVLNAMRNMKA